MKYTSNEMCVAKKYASAFLNCFRVQVTYGDILKIELAQRFLKDHRKALFFLQLPQFNQSVRLSLVEDLVGYFSLPSVCTKIILLLILHNRSLLIPDVLFFIASLYKQIVNVIDFDIKSAYSLTDGQRKIVKTFLDRSTGKNSMCVYTVDKQLIAGIRAQSTKYIWEYSVRKQLSSLRATVK